MSKHLNVIVDDETVAALECYMQQHRLSQSQALRDLLNHALKVAQGPDAGWQEGRNEARALALQIVNAAFAEMPENAPSKPLLEQIKLRVRQFFVRKK